MDGHAKERSRSLIERVKEIFVEIKIRVKIREKRGFLDSKDDKARVPIEPASI